MKESFKTLLIFAFVFISASGAFSQKEQDVNELFSVRIDSIVRFVSEDRATKGASIFLYYTIKNISSDTLIYITNTCFYYNHYSLYLGDSFYDINKEGDCLYNSYCPYELFPDEEFSRKEDIYAKGLKSLNLGLFEYSIIIPLTQNVDGIFYKFLEKDESKMYKVYGITIYEDSKFLKATGQTEIIEKYFYKPTLKDKFIGFFKK